MFDQIITWLTPLRVESISIALISAVIGTFGGALGGAWGAEKIASAKVKRTRFLQEIGETNSAIELSFAVCNRALAQKSQHTQELAARFREQQQAVHAHHRRISEGTMRQGMVLVIRFVDQMWIETFRAPIERLENTVLEKITARGKIPQQVITLAGCVESLNDTIRSRNALVDRYNRGEFDEPERSQRMFGLPMADGAVDMTYSELTLGLEKQTDDCIYFSKRLCDELYRHGQGIYSRYPRRFRRHAPRIVGCDFNRAEAQGLIPDSAQFGDWENAFVGRVRHTKGAHLQKWLLVARRMTRMLDRIMDRTLRRLTRATPE